MEEPPDCKYKIICKWYEKTCYEPKCWRAIFLDDIIPNKHLNTLDELIYNGNTETKSNGLRLDSSERSSNE